MIQMLVKYKAPDYLHTRGETMVHAWKKYSNLTFFTILLCEMRELLRLSVLVDHFSSNSKNT